MRHTKHLWRAGLILLFAGISAFLLRSLFVPKSFGRYGFYRGDAVKEEMAKPTHLGSADACRDCHSAEWGKRESGPHLTLACVSCHGPLDSHIAEGKKVGEMKTQKQAELCLRCHQFLVSRPANFPQIDLEKHLELLGVEFSSEACFDCHNPHHPKEGME